MPTESDIKTKAAFIGQAALKPFLKSEEITKEQFKEINKSIAKELAASYKGELDATFEKLVAEKVMAMSRQEPDPPAAASSLLPPRHLVLAAMPAQPSEIEVAFCDAALRDAGYVVATGGEDVQYPPARCVALLRQEETLLGLDCEEMLLSEYESDCHTDS